MAKRKKLGKYVVRVKAGHATVNIHGKTKSSAQRNATHFIKRHMKNVEQGFYDDTGFHPIRGSKDYIKARAGEGRTAGAKRRRTAKAARKWKESLPK
jgi:hypothetical protein